VYHATPPQVLLAFRSSLELRALGYHAASEAQPAGGVLDLQGGADAARAGLQITELGCGQCGVLGAAADSAGDGHGHVFFGTGGQLNQNVVWFAVADGPLDQGLHDAVKL
jgi:hypothetical protein